MSESDNPAAQEDELAVARATESVPPGPHGARRRSPSMHEGIAVWCDCCSCEAEPYWVEIAKEMGLELGSDYEDEPR